jgi:hypothetical protein
VTAPTQRRVPTGRPGDVDRMIAWLEQHRDEIARLCHGRVAFDLHEGSIRARIERSEKLPGQDGDGGG